MDDSVCAWQDEWRVRSLGCLLVVLAVVAFLIIFVIVVLAFFIVAVIRVLIFVSSLTRIVSSISSSFNFYTYVVCVVGFVRRVTSSRIAKHIHICCGPAALA